MYDPHPISQAECFFCGQLQDSMTVLAQHVAQVHQEEATRGEKIHAAKNFDNVISFPREGSRTTVKKRRS